MPRGRKQMTLEEELTYLDQQIEKTSETLDTLKKRRKEVAQLKEQKDLQTIYEKIQASQMPLLREKAESPLQLVSEKSGGIPLP